MNTSFTEQSDVSDMCKCNPAVFWRGTITFMQLYNFYNEISSIILGYS